MTSTSSSTDFSPLPKTRAFEDIVARIRAHMQARQYEPGERLASERELCEQFQVSRNTLREALRSLENAGLLSFRKGANGGVFAAHVSGSAVIVGLNDMCQLGSIKPAELIEARIWVESAAIRAAAKNVTAAEIDAMARNIEQAASAGESGDFLRRVEINLDFHRMIAHATHNGVMVTLMEALLQATHQVIVRLEPYDNSFIPAARRVFLKHFAAGNVDKAVLDMEKQLAKMQKIYFSKLPPTP
ncbi:MAG: FadR/GntR family transcriptional regulator [Janthinobacterium lividum]